MNVSDAFARFPSRVVLWLALLVLLAVSPALTGAQDSPPIQPSDGTGDLSETAVATTESAETPEREPDPLAGDDGYTTILLIGGDSGPQRVGLRTDAMIVVSVNRETKQAAIFSIPRNLAMVPLPPESAQWFDCACFPSLLNELYAYAEANPDLFPSASGRPGADAMKGAIGNLLGLPIDYFALVGFSGFVDVIDALGGVDIVAPETVSIYLSPAKEGEPWEQFIIQAGEQRLDGRAALAYVRSREGESDYDRMTRQRCVLGGLAARADPSRLVRAYPELLSQLKESILTDVPRDDLPALIELAAAINLDEVSTIGFVPPNYTAGWVNPGYPIPDLPSIQQTVRDALDHPLETASEHFGSLTGTCAIPGGTT